MQPPKLHPWAQSLSVLAFSLLFSWGACAPQGTPCKTDAECLNGFYCAETDKQQKFCIRRPGGNDSSSPTDRRVDPPGDRRVDPPADRRITPPGDRRVDPPADRRVDPPADRRVDPPADRRITPPDDRPPSGCIPPPYDPSKDPGNGGKAATLDGLDKAFFKKLRDILHASNIAQCKDAIWGNKYEMHKIPTYVVNVGSGQAGTGKGVRGFLYNHPSPPSGATLVDSKLVFGLKNIYLYNGAKNNIQQPGFDFGMQIGGVATYAFEYGSSDDFIDPTKGREVFAFFVHEGFHRAQEYEENWKQASGNQDTSKYPLDANSLALALLEGRILLAGYKGADPATTLKQYYATQLTRFQQDKSGVLKAHDALQEWLEGTAQYAEHHYVKVIGDPYPDSDINSLPMRLSINEQLLDDPNYKPTREDLLNFFTARFYGTGGILGIMLDRLSPDDKQGWKNQIRNGRTFHEILASKYSSIDVPQTLQAAKTQHKFSELEALAKRYAAIR